MPIVVRIRAQSEFEIRAARVYVFDCAVYLSGGNAYRAALSAADLLLYLLSEDESWTD